MTVHIVGSGIASLSAAVYLIEKARVDPHDIIVYEESDKPGGAMAMGKPVEPHNPSEPDFAYVLPATRILEREYRCAKDLLSRFPSKRNHDKNIWDECVEFNNTNPYYDTHRLLDKHLKVFSQPQMGVDLLTRLGAARLLAEGIDDDKPGKPLLDDVPVRGFFPDDFYRSEFFLAWSTMMGPLPDHSAIEFRRYLLRFLHVTPCVDTMKDVWRMPLNQDDGVALPIREWLETREWFDHSGKGVEFRCNTTVEDVTFRKVGGGVRADSIRLKGDAKPRPIDAGDYVFITLGSQTANLSIGKDDEPPQPVHEPSKAWSLWSNIKNNAEAIGRYDFGDPKPFFDSDDLKPLKPGDVEKDPFLSTWVTFTVTEKGQTFLKRLQKLTGDPSLNQGLVTLIDSPWMITVSPFPEKHFLNQPDGVSAWWGFSLCHDKSGNPNEPGGIGKTITECTGREILTETVRQFGFQSDEALILSQSVCIPCLLPNAGSVWMRRKRADRPNVVPEGAENFAFLGQFCEMPFDTMFTMEYSIRSARQAVVGLFNVANFEPPRVYQGDAAAMLAVLERFVFH